MKKNLTPFGEQVKKALVEKRMSQVELAQAVGTSLSFLNLMLDGTRPGKKYRGKIAALLGIQDDPPEEWSHTMGQKGSYQ